MADRLTNYLFGFIVIVAFVLFADSTDRTWILAALILGSATALLAYLNNLLSMDGAAAALVVGVVSMGFGGVAGILLILFFFCSSYGLTWWLEYRNRTGSDKYGYRNKEFLSERRTGIQVWANAFWFVLMLTIGFITEDNLYLVAAAAAMAAATSDTWASLVGIHKSGNTRLITTLQHVKPGTDGGISYYGTIAALAGALSVAVLYMPAVWSPEPKTAAIIFVSGFSGCIVDSYLGAIFQVHIAMKRPDKQKTCRLLSIVAGKWAPGNNMVNFLATGVAAFIAVLLS